MASRQSYIRTLARALHPARARERWLLVISYIDAAGTHDGARCLSLAVYVAPDATWERFEEAWQAILDDEEIPRLHMTDLEAADEKKGGVFKGWDRARKDALLARFAPVVRMPHIWGFADAVDTYAYRHALGRRMRTSLERRQRDFENPRVFMLWTLIGMVYSGVKHWFPSEPAERVSVICDLENAGIKGILLDHYDDMLKGNPHLKDWLDPGLAFKSSSLALPLQAADFLAWEIAMEMRQRSKPFHRDPVRESYKALAFDEGLGGNAIVHFFDEPKIDRFSRKARRRRLI